MYWNTAVTFTAGTGLGLIETWDVLKWQHKTAYIIIYMINRNMRCIEMMEKTMNCLPLSRLIETWDVLK